MLTLIKLGKRAGHSTSAEQGKFRRAKTPPKGGGDCGEVGQVGGGVTYFKAQSQNNGTN